MDRSGEPTRKRGRKTKQEEAQEYLRSVGLDPDEILQQAESVEIEIPEDEQELLEAFKKALYVQMVRGELGGTALVAGLKAVAQLADTARQEHPPEVVEVRGVDEILADANLPRERRIDIGRTEIERLRGHTIALELVVAQIEGEE